MNQRVNSVNAKIDFFPAVAWNTKYLYTKLLQPYNHTHAHMIYTFTHVHMSWCVLTELDMVLQVSESICQSDQPWYCNVTKKEKHFPTDHYYTAAKRDVSVDRMPQIE